MIINIASAGVITAAPTLAEVLLRVLNFLLTVVGIVAVIGMLLSGVIYLTALGDEKRIKLAKKSFNYSVVGTVIVFIALIVVMTITMFIS